MKPSNRKKIVLLTDFARGSYKVIGELYHSLLSPLYDVEHLHTPQNQEDRLALAKRFSSGIILHNTLGDGFVPLEGCYNIAIPHHEWSEYPTPWIGLLNKFDEIWTTTNHIRELLQRGGLKAPSFLLPPALDQENFIPKSDWEIYGKPSFLFVGESHFRKGNHLLIDGFLKAFPNPDMACLTIKTAPNCPWDSPREDIIVEKEEWSRDKLLAEYSRHDCFASASLGEGLGLPVAEAIMSELPICTNFWGGHKSLLCENSFVRMEHEEIPQPYSSDPKFYADGQKCSFSSPEEVKKSLLSFLALNPKKRESMSASAKQFFAERYGSPKAGIRIMERIEKIHGM